MTQTQQKAFNNVVVVASGKGGVGKTWFSVTFAHALEQLGKKVLIFDGDIGLANVDIQLGLTPQYDLVNFLQGTCTIDQAIVPYSQNIHIFAGRSGSGAISALDPLKRVYLKQTLGQLSQKYDVLIIDLGAGIDSTLQELSELGKQCLVLTTDEPTAMTDAYAFIKVVGTKNQQTSMRIIINKAENEKEGLKTYQTLAKVCENFLKKIPPLCGVIRNDTRVRDSIRNQTSIFARFPNAPATQDVIKIALSTWQSIEGFSKPKEVGESAPTP